FFATAADWFRLTPMWHLTIHASQDDHLDDEGLHRLAAMPELARVEGLCLWDQQSARVEGWEALVRSPQLLKLRSPSVPNGGLAEDVVTALAASPSLAGLTALDLWNNPIGVAGAQAILDSPHLKRLRILQIVECFYGDEEGEDEILDALQQRFGDGLR